MASGTAGRKPATTRHEIATICIDLFTERGFDETSVDDIAAAAGIARRTFFRYFPSKNAAAWGDFDNHLAAFRTSFAMLPASMPIATALTTALVRFNTFPDSEVETHRKRMRLLLNVPALQAYSMLMYEEWRNAVAEYVARRIGCAPTDHGPRTAGWLLLAIAISAYEQWLANEAGAHELTELLSAGARTLESGLAALVPEPPRPVNFQ